MANKLYTVLADGTDPYANLALEEHLLSRVGDGSVILYLWQNAHTVVIGRNQNPWAECRTSLLEQEGGHLARRLSGGGAVYHDMGNLNFTFLCATEHYDLQKQLQVIKTACDMAGIRAEFSGRNDLLAQGKKFSGSAFYHSKGLSYHHGTLLIRSDMEKLGRYLSPPKAKLASKGVASVRSRVINLSQLQPQLDCAQMGQLMIAAFSRVYGGIPAPLPLTDKDLQAVRQLSDRYAHPQWLYGRPMPFSCQLEGSFPWGQLTMQLQVEGGVIRALQIYTDAMDASLPQTLSQALTGIPFRTDALCDALAPLENGHQLSDFIRQQHL